MAIVGIVLGALWTVFRDCTALIPAGWVGDVPVIDCAKPHREEVYAVLTLSGSKYPGDTEVENQANELCNDKLDSMLTDDAELALRPPYAHARAKALVDLCSDVLVALQRRLGCASCALINLVDFEPDKLIEAMIMERVERSCVGFALQFKNHRQVKVLN